MWTSTSKTTTSCGTYVLLGSDADVDGANELMSMEDAHSYFAEGTPHPSGAPRPASKRHAFHKRWSDARKARGCLGCLDFDDAAFAKYGYTR